MRRTPARPEEAVRYYMAACALRPDSVEAWHGLGIAHERLKEHGKAVNLFRTAVERWPQDAHLRWHLGKGLYATGRHDKAIEEYRAAIKINLKSAEAYRSQGNVLRLEGKLEEAI